MYEDDQEIPVILHNPKNSKFYIRENQIGNGKFGKCYKVRYCKSSNVFAVKVVSKSYKRWMRIKEEVAIHKHLNHKNIVKFEESFDDSKFVYVILEYCNNKTLHDLQKYRLKFSYPEVRFYMKQILAGMKYLHEDMSIVHGDLKLSNILLNNDLVIKICDFGFATKLKHPGDYKKPRGGTAGFSAPEIVCFKPFGFEADIWSLGCIFYTLLLSKKPFKAGTKSETRAKVCRCDYYLPSVLNKAASEIIVKTLMPDPSQRLTVTQLCNMPFLKGKCLDRQTLLNLYSSPRARRFKRHCLEKANNVQSEENVTIKI